MGEVILEELPEDATPVGAVFEGALELAAVRMTPPAPKPGDRVELEYFWRAKKPFARDVKVFVHGDALEGDARRIHGDHWPARGRYPSGVWQVGEVIRDTFSITIPPGYGPRRLGLYSGLYRDKDRLDLTEKGKVAATGDDRSLAVKISF